MMHPIYFRVRKKTKTPTKSNLVYQYRYDWKTVGIIGYNESPLLFKSINGRGKFETDAEFAKWLKDNFGTGVYFIQAWRKGKEGFWSFMKVQCNEISYIRLMKSKTSTQKENEKTVTQYKEMKEQLKFVDEERREELQEQFDELQDDMSLNKEIIEMERSLSRGTGFYLKTLKPIYREHLYNEPYRENIYKEIQQIDKQTNQNKSKQQEQEVEFQSLW